MNDPRMGLGTDQLELPAMLADEFSTLPGPPHSDTFDAPGPMPSGAEAADLAPWARRMQLPGIDT